MDVVASQKSRLFCFIALTYGSGKVQLLSPLAFSYTPNRDGTLFLVIVIRVDNQILQFYKYTYMYIHTYIHKHTHT